MPTGAHILVVDSTTNVLRLMEGVLSQAGYEVSCVSSGEEALKNARDRPPALMFVGFLLNDMNGYDLCKQAGQDDATENVPIVMMSTRTDSVGEQFVRELGIVDHITKPFAPETLLALTQHLLAKLSGRPTPAPLRAELTPADRVITTQELARPNPKRLAAKLAAALSHRPPSVEDVETLAKELQTPEMANALRDFVMASQPQHALSGDLGIIPLAEVFQMLALQRQTGEMRVSRGDSDIVLAFHEGSIRMVTATNMPEEFLLGKVLVREKLIDSDELHVFLSNRKGTKRRLGEQAVQLGYLDDEQLHLALRRQSSELVYELLRWGSGRFSFVRKESSEEHDINFHLSVDELLMEGFRRVDEWSLIEKTLPNLDIVPIQIPGGLENLSGEGLTKQEKAVWEQVDGKRDVRAIVEALGAGTFEVSKILYRLISMRTVAVRRVLG